MLLKRFYVFLPALILTVLAIPHLQKPPTSDEFDFYNAAQAFAESNSLYYFRAFIDEFIIPQGGAAYQPWVYHPPLAIFIMGLLLKLFGSNILVLRLFSLACNLLVLSLIPKLYRSIYPNDNNKYGAFLASIIFISIPLTLHSSLLLDIDNSLLNILNVIACILLFAYFKKDTTEQKLPKKFLFALVILFTFFHLTKLTHYPIFIIVFCVSAALKGRILSGVVSLLVLLIGSKAIGSMILTAVELWFSIDYQWAAIYTNSSERLLKVLQQFLNPSVLFLHWFSDIKLRYLTPAIPWLLLTLLVTTIYNLLASLINVIQKKSALFPYQINNQTIVTIICLGIYICMGGFLGQIPKYQIAIIPLLACILAYYLSPLFQRYKLPLFSSITALIIILIYYFSDSNLLRSTNLDTLKITFASLFVFILLLVLPTQQQIKNRIILSLYSSLSILTICFGLAVNISSITQKGDVTYYYGNKGVKEAAEFVNQHLPESTYFLGDPGIGQLTGNQNFIWLFFIHPNQMEILPGQPLGLKVNMAENRKCSPPQQNYSFTKQTEESRICTTFPIGIIEIKPTPSFFQTKIEELIALGYREVKIKDVYLMVWPEEE